MGRSFIFTQANSSPFSGLDGTVTFSDGTATSDKILVMAVNGLGAPTLQTQTQKAPFQQGASMIRTLFQPRTITLECAIAVAGASSSGLAEVTTIKRSLSHRLSPVGMGFLPNTSLSSSAYSTYLGKLSYASDGVTYDRFIDVVPMTVEFPNAYYQDGFQKMRVVFFCPDPFWYGADQTSAMSQVALANSGDWVDVEYSPELNLFCMIANGSTNIQTSPDGITWTLRTGASSAAWSDMTWSPELGIFCAVAQGSTAIQTSPDGINWTLRTGASANGLNAITWSSSLGIFCAGDSNNTNIQTSPDGINWTLRTGASANGVSGIVWSEELGIFCTCSGTGTSIQTSPDGINWTLRTGALSGGEDIVWSKELGLFCVAGTTTATAVETSPDGITWTSRTVSSSLWKAVSWSPELGLFCLTSGTYGDIETSPDGITWTSRTGVSASLYAVTWSSELGVFCAASFQAGEYPAISYDGINWVQNSATTDWYLAVNNQGDVPADFEITIPIKGAETGKVVAIGENFLWAGAGEPPSDHNIVFSTEGLKTGDVVLSTKFGSKTITQFGQSVLNKFIGGTFFTLYVTGSASNILYLRNTGTPAGAPSITWRNRYLGV
jgi:hypothetical protein